MRTFDPNRASVKQIFETKPAEKTEKIEASLPKETLPEPYPKGLETVLGEITDKLLEQQQNFTTIYQEDGQKYQQTLAQLTAIIEKTAIPIPLPSISTPILPISYIFEIERDEQGRIAKIYVNPVSVKTE